MLMNRAETELVNSAPRRWLQTCYEVPVLLPSPAVKTSSTKHTSRIIYYRDQ
jgi:hypothetical protein